MFKEILVVRQLEGWASVEAILEGHKFNGYPGFIPFAVDSGGWDLNVSVNESTAGQVWVDRFDDLTGTGSLLRPMQQF